MLYYSIMEVFNMFKPSKSITLKFSSVKNLKLNNIGYREI